MTTQPFPERWNDGPYPSPLLTIEDSPLLPISDERFSFLRDAGLPEDAAPFLSFAQLKELETVSSAWGLEAKFDRYVMIGSDGEGSPICVDRESDGKVELLDHESAFAATFMNSDVARLADCLLAFRCLVQNTQERNGDDAYLDGDVPADLIDRLESVIFSTDAPAMLAGSFWSQQIGVLRQEAA